MRTASPRRALPALTALVCALLCALFLLHAKAVMDGVASAPFSLRLFGVSRAFSLFCAHLCAECFGVLTRAGRRCAPLMRPLGPAGRGGRRLFGGGRYRAIPWGARLAAGLHLSQNQTERLVGLANLAGPMFLSGTVAASLLGAPALGWALILSQLLAALAAAGVSGALSAREEAAAPAAAPGGSVPAPFRPGTALLDAIVSGMLAMLRVCGAIVFFSALLCALRECGLFVFAHAAFKSAGPAQRIGRRHGLWPVRKDQRLRGARQLFAPPPRSACRRLLLFCVLRRAQHSGADPNVRSGARLALPAL